MKLSGLPFDVAQGREALERRSPVCSKCLCCLPGSAVLRASAPPREDESLPLPLAIKRESVYKVFRRRGGTGKGKGGAHQLPM